MIIHGFLTTIGGNDRGGDTKFGAVCETKEVAELAAKNRGAFGGTNMVENVLCVKGEDGKTYLLGKFGVDGYGENAVPVEVDIIPANATEAFIEEYFHEQALKKKQREILKKLTPDEREVIKDLVVRKMI